MSNGKEKEIEELKKFVDEFNLFGMTKELQKRESMYKMSGIWDMNAMVRFENVTGRFMSHYMEELDEETLKLASLFMADRNAKTYDENVKMICDVLRKCHDELEHRPMLQDLIKKVLDNAKPVGSLFKRF